MAAKTAKKTAKKGRGGRPPGAKNRATLQRELDEARAQLRALEAERSQPGNTADEPPGQEEAPPVTESPAPASGDDVADPFAETVKPAPVAMPSPPPSGEDASDPEPELPRDAVPPMPGDTSVPMPERRRMGEAHAQVLFTVLCTIYDEGLAEPLALMVVRSKLEQVDRATAGAAWGQCLETAKLSDADRETLGPPVVSRLAELEVDPDFDLWFALLVVFGTKFVLLRTLAANPAAAAEMQDFMNKVQQSDTDDGAGGVVVDITPRR